MSQKRWHHRPPPDDCIPSQLMICIMPRPCVFQDNCQNAHSEGELLEWKERLKFKDYSTDNSHDIPDGSLEEHRKDILKKLNESEDPKRAKLVITELIGDFTILCDENLYIMHVERGKELAWMFTVKHAKKFPGRLLERVFFLNDCQEFKMQYTVIRKSAHHVCSTLPEDLKMWENKHKEQQDVGILIQFKAEKYGNYVQEIIFDFGGFPKVIRKLGVQVASEESLRKIMTFDPKKNENNEMTWMKNYKVKKYDGGQLEDLSSISYQLPANIENLVKFDAFKHLDLKLTRGNYRQRLHTLLYVEEYQRRANLQIMTLHIDDFGLCLNKGKSNPESGHIATTSLPDHFLAELGKLVGKSGKALLRVNEYATRERVMTNPEVFEVIVQNIVNNSLHLQLNEELYKLVSASAIPVTIDICFCLVDIFQPLHKAIEKVDLDILFPTFTSKIDLPYTSNIYNDSKLSPEQRKAVNVMISSKEKAPVLVLGPFGAGKTLAIAKCIENLLTVENPSGGKKNKILICTHSNSAGDHYIEDYFHPKHLKTTNPINKDLIPLRINWQHRYISSVSDKVLAYCLQDLNTGLFGIPTKKDLDKHSLIICTSVTSELLSNLDLPGDYFSHIFIDEAAQAMEVESLVPLLLATPETRIVLAGDHLQMGENLSSSVAQNLGLEKSLLERLFEYYPFDADCKLKLLENFRSYEEIVRLSSYLFYEDSLLCNKKREVGAKFPVEFYGVDGAETFSKDNPSYENTKEATEVLARIRKISIENKMDENFRLSCICVVAFYPAQVRHIRKILRKNKMSAVRVESVNNIQGLEFDILIMSTVRTHCKSTLNDQVSRKDMGFLTNPKLLNTAITRARYRVVFIGDPNALCNIGECKPCWKFILKYCEINKTFNYRLTSNELMKTQKGSPLENKSKNNSKSIELILERFDKTVLNPKKQKESSLIDTKTPTQCSPFPQVLKKQGYDQEEQHQQKLLKHHLQQQQHHQKLYLHRQQQLLQHHHHNQQQYHQQQKRQQYIAHHIPYSQVIGNSRVIHNLYQPNPLYYMEPELLPVYPPQGFAYPTFIPNVYSSQFFLQESAVGNQNALYGDVVSNPLSYRQLPRSTEFPSVQETLTRSQPPPGLSPKRNASGEYDGTASLSSSPLATPPKTSSINHVNDNVKQISHLRDSQIQPMRSNLPFPEHPMVSYNRVLQQSQNIFHGPEIQKGFEAPLSQNELPPPLSRGKLILIPAENMKLLHLKIRFIQDYCMDVLKFIVAKKGVTSYVQRSMMNAFQDLENIEGDCEDLNWANKVRLEIEMKVELSFMFVQDQMKLWKNKGTFDWSETKSAGVKDVFNQVKKELDHLENFIAQAKSNKMESEEPGAQSNKEMLDSIKFLCALIKQEFSDCEKLVNSSNEVFLEIKLNILRKQFLGIEKLQEEYLKSVTLYNLRTEDLAAEMKSSFTILYNYDYDKDVEDWFSTRRNDPYVQEYQASHNRRLAQRLPSPSPDDDDNKY